MGNRGRSSALVQVEHKPTLPGAEKGPPEGRSVAVRRSAPGLRGCRAVVIEWRNDVASARLIGEVIEMGPYETLPDATKRAELLLRREATPKPVRLKHG